MAVDRGIQAAPQGAWQHVSEVIDRLRRYWRLTQEQLAEGITMSQRQLSGRLSCERHWNEEELADVAAFFKVSVGDLYGPPDEAIAASTAGGGPDNASGNSDPAPAGLLLADATAA